MLYEAIVPKAGQAGHLVVVIDHEAVPRVEVGVAAAEGEVVRVGNSIQTRRTATAFVAGSIVNRVRPSVIRLEPQSVGELLLKLDLQRVVVGNAGTGLRANAGEDVSGSVHRMVRKVYGLSHTV